MKAGMFFIILFISGYSSYADSYTACSLRNAFQQINNNESSDEAFYCGNINKPFALIYDEVNDDIILIGKKLNNRNKIAYSDWIVATRAIIVNKKDPAVSIDRTDETDKNQMQKVRLEGGIENTQFGKDLFDADVVLKRLGIGTLTAEIFGIESYLKMSADEYRKTGDKSEVISRFWFHPKKESSYISAKNGVVVVEEYEVGVKNEVMSGGGDRDIIAEKFPARASSYSSFVSTLIFVPISSNRASLL